MLEAQASGLPVVAVDAGGPAELIADGRTGLLCPPDAGDARPAAVTALAASRGVREGLGRGGVDAVAGRSWEAALERLAAGWQQALAPAARGVRAA